VKKFYGCGIAGVDPSRLSGKLIVIEGADGSGRSTQIARLSGWLEGAGHAVEHMGIKRSMLVGEDLDRAKQGNVLGRTTMSLFYATDFADQLQNRIIPALRAGFIVLADRYIYTLMARDIVRGSSREWVENLYRTALIPDAVFYLKVSPHLLMERTFLKAQTLDYWESGMDIRLGEGLFDSFLKYQKLISAEFTSMAAAHNFHVVNGNRATNAVFQDLRRNIEALLARPAPRSRK
jgi:dTMP kinase